jgi:hypothetical protein
VHTGIAAQLGPEDWNCMSGGRESEFPGGYCDQLNLNHVVSTNQNESARTHKTLMSQAGDPIDKQMLEAVNFEGQSQDHRTVTWVDTRWRPVRYKDKRDASEYYPSHIQWNALSILLVENS